MLSYNESYVFEKVTSKAKLKVSKFSGEISSLQTRLEASL